MSKKMTAPQTNITMVKPKGTTDQRISNQRSPSMGFGRSSWLRRRYWRAWTWCRGLPRAFPRFRLSTSGLDRPPSGRSPQIRIAELRERHLDERPQYELRSEDEWALIFRVGMVGIDEGRYDALMNDGVSRVRKAHEPLLKTRNLNGLGPAIPRERPVMHGSFGWRPDPRREE